MKYKFGHNLFFLLTFNIGVYGYSLDHGKNWCFRLIGNIEENQEKNRLFYNDTVKVARDPKPYI